MEYFSTGPAGHTDASGHYVELAAEDGFQPLEGVTMRATGTPRLLVSLVDLEPGAIAPVHTHYEEQIGTVLRGQCEFELDGSVRTLGEGDVYIAPAWVPHGLTAGRDGCQILDAFTPAREALIPQSKIFD